MSGWLKRTRVSSIPFVTLPKLLARAEFLVVGVLTPTAMEEGVINRTPAAFVDSSAIPARDQHLERQRLHTLSKDAPKHLERGGFPCVGASPKTASARGVVTEPAPALSTHATTDAGDYTVFQGNRAND